MVTKGVIFFILLVNFICLGTGGEPVWANGNSVSRAGLSPISPTQSQFPGSKSPLEFFLTSTEGGQNHSRGQSISLAGATSLAVSPEIGSQSGASAKINLSKNTELRISFLYNKEAPDKFEGTTPSHLLFKYDMDYNLMPNLQVGLTGYFYQPSAADYMAWRNSKLPEPILGLGPGIKYNLGRWSFLINSQLQTDSHARSDSINNWFKVWYAF